MTRSMLNEYNEWCFFGGSNQKKHVMPMMLLIKRAKHGFFQSPLIANATF